MANGLTNKFYRQCGHYHDHLNRPCHNSHIWSTFICDCHSRLVPTNVSRCSVSLARILDMGNLELLTRGMLSSHEYFCNDSLLAFCKFMNLNFIFAYRRRHLPLVRWRDQNMTIEYYWDIGDSYHFVSVVFKFYLYCVSLYISYDDPKSAALFPLNSVLLHSRSELLKAITMEIFTKESERPPIWRALLMGRCY